MTRIAQRLGFNTALLTISLFATGGCATEGKFPGGCDGPKYSVDAQPNGGNDAGS